MAVLFNFIILRIKWNRRKYADVSVDVAMLFLLNVVFGSSILGVVSATFGSVLISLYLIWYPLKLFKDSGDADSTCELTPEQRAFNRMADKFDGLFD